VDLDWKPYGENHEGTKYRPLGTILEIFERILNEPLVDPKKHSIHAKYINNNPKIISFSCQGINLTLTCSLSLTQDLIKNPKIKEYIDFYEVGTYQKVGQRTPETRLQNFFRAYPHSSARENERFKELKELIFPDKPKDLPF
tara:strand:+ start:16065 stop:16490 length:426 start_codon:yes stop_codon:yes gene_type:complete